MGIKHAYTSAVSDMADTTRVRPSNWNADHIIDSAINLPAGSTLAGSAFATAIYKNVRSYGAVGDGVTDDTVAIQAALDDDTGDYSNNSVGVIYFPVGDYKITSAINYSRSGHLHLCLLGEHGARIGANFSGQMFSRNSTGGITYTTFSIENLQFGNQHATGGCVDIADNIVSVVRNCSFGVSGDGPMLRSQVDPCFIYSCNFVASGLGLAGNSVGIKGGSLVVEACSFTQCGIGIQCFGTPSLTAIANRFEVNGNAIQCGGDFSEAFFARATNEPGYATIIGGHFESNSKHVYVPNGGVNMHGCAMSSFNANCTHGLHIENSLKATVTDCDFGANNYSVNAVVITPSADHYAQNIHFANVAATSTGWTINTNVDTTSWFLTDYPKAWTRKQVGYTGTIGFDVTTINATITSGAITVTGNYMKIDTEGLAATDDLDTINGADLGSHGSRLVLRAANSARTVVVKDGTNLKLAGDFSLDNEEDTIELIWDAALGKWLEIGRSDNGA